MPSFFRKKRSTVDLTLQDARTATAHGGQLIVDALAKDFGLWEKIRACCCMDPRKDKSRGFSPVVDSAHRAEGKMKIQQA